MIRMLFANCFFDHKLVITPALPLAAIADSMMDLVQRVIVAEIPKQPNEVPEQDYSIGKSSGLCESLFSLNLDTFLCNTPCPFRPTVFERITSVTNAIYDDTDSMKCIIYLLITVMDSSFQFN